MESGREGERRVWGWERDQEDDGECKGGGTFGTCALSSHLVLSNLPTMYF